MVTDVMIPDWIKRIVDDERARDAVRQKEEQVTARKADLVRVHGRRLIDELRTTMKRDIEAFRGAFAGDPARDIVFSDAPSDGGFAVRKPDVPGVSLTVAWRVDAAGGSCHYRFTPANGLPPREDRLDLVFADDGVATLQIRHHGTGQLFATADALSEFLLVPVFTGRPR